MAQTPYVKDPITGKYHELTTVIIDGVATLYINDVGVTTPPPYIPTATEPLITQSDYKAIMGISTISDESKWTFAALAVSDMVERRCFYSWRNAEKVVPYGLQVIVARATANLMNVMIESHDASIQSESFSSYSYSLTQNSASILSAFIDDLRCYIRPFLGI